MPSIPKNKHSKVKKISLLVILQKERGVIGKERKSTCSKTVEKYAPIKKAYIYIYIRFNTQSHKVSRTNQPNQPYSPARPTHPWDPSTRPANPRLMPGPPNLHRIPQIPGSLSPLFCPRNSGWWRRRRIGSRGGDRERRRREADRPLPSHPHPAWPLNLLYAAMSSGAGEAVGWERRRRCRLRAAPEWNTVCSSLYVALR
jgi:hypothetical protein